MQSRYTFLFAAVVMLVACNTSPTATVPRILAPSTPTSDAFLGIPARIATTPFPTVALPEQPAPNFAFSIGYGGCTITRVLDTFTGTLTQHSMDGSDAAVSFTLTSDEREVVYQAIKNINLFGYPNVYVIPVPDNELRIISAPHPRYELILRNGTLDKTITWEDDISRPTALEADQLRDFIGLVKALVEQHSDTTQLPPLVEECA